MHNLIEEEVGRWEGGKEEGEGGWRGGGVRGVGEGGGGRRGRGEGALLTVGCGTKWLQRFESRDSGYTMSSQHMHCWATVMYIHTYVRALSQVYRISIYSSAD